MEKKGNATLNKNELINSKYKVLLFIKQAANAETYRVKSEEGKVYFLKLFYVSKTHPSAFDEHGNLLEIELLKQIRHPNIVGYQDSGEFIAGHRKYFYLVLDFIAGETLAERMERQKISTAYDVKQIALGILNGLHYLHTLPDCIVHNEITPQNVMLDLSGDMLKPVIIDFGHARSFYQSSKSYYREDLNPYYLAPECYGNLFSPQSDLFALGVMMYQMLYGMLPWFKEIAPYRMERERLEDLITNERRKPLQFLNVNYKIIGLDEYFSKIVAQALQSDLAIRFQSAATFMEAINNPDSLELQNNPKAGMAPPSASQPSRIEKSPGTGFDAVAGMKDLKEQMQTEVIDALLYPEQYKEYGLTIPNGMLLYGPPGCGKTFFAKRLAEEVGYTFLDIKPSDLASIYVHGAQEKIAKLFEEARKNAPTILFIDELDALVPNRESDLNHSYAGEVNEFLAQMTDSAQHGVFIIGASNRPEKIDLAVMRAGRLDKKVYIPPPDLEARKAMFELHLQNRPLDFGIDYEQLAALTENFVASDIELIVNNAARKALREKIRISMAILLNVIAETHPSVPLSEIRKYEALRAKMEGESGSAQEKRPIGFNKN